MDEYLVDIGDTCYVYLNGYTNEDGQQCSSLINVTLGAISYSTGVFFTETTRNRFINNTICIPYTNPVNAYTALVVSIMALVFYAAAAGKIILDTFVRKVQTAKQRQSTMGIIIIIACAVLQSCGLLREYVGRVRYPCNMTLWCTSVGYTLLFGAITARLTVFVSKYVYLESYRKELRNVFQINDAPVWIDLDTVEQGSSLRRVDVQTKGDVFQIPACNSNDFTGLPYPTIFESSKKLRILKFISSRRCSLSVLGLIVVAVTATVAVVQSNSDNHCVGCFFPYSLSLTATMVLLVAIGALATLFVAVYLYIRRLPDPLMIVYESGILSICMFGIFLTFLFGFIDPYDAIAAQYWTPDYIITVACVVIVFTITFLHSIKIQAVRLRLSSKDIYHFLNDKTACGFFEQYLVSELAVENLYFWQAASRFSESAPEERKKLFQRMYRSFIASDSLLPINISDEARLSLVVQYREMQRDDTFVIQGDIFERASKEIFGILNGSFMGFLGSQYCKDYETFQIPLIHQMNRSG